MENLFIFLYLKDLLFKKLYLKIKKISKIKIFKIILTKLNLFKS